MEQLGSDTTLSISFVISLIAISLTIYGFFNSYKKSILDTANEETDNKSEIEGSLIRLELKLDEVCRASQNTQVAMEYQRQAMEDVKRLIAVQDRDITTLFKYKDEHSKRLDKLEGK